MVPHPTPIISVSAGPPSVRGRELVQAKVGHDPGVMSKFSYSSGIFGLHQCEQCVRQEVRSVAKLSSVFERPVATISQSGSRKCRGGNCSVCCHFWLFRRPRSKGQVGKAELRKRFDLSGEGRWMELHREASQDHPTATARSHVQRAEGKSC